MLGKLLTLLLCMQSGFSTAHMVVARDFEERTWEDPLELTDMARKKEHRVYAMARKGKETVMMEVTGDGGVQNEQAMARDARKLNLGLSHVLDGKSQLVHFKTSVFKKRARKKIISNISLWDSYPYGNMSSLTQKTADDDEQKTMRRMKWWAKPGTVLPPKDSYVLLSNDAGGPNNIRIGWEMAGLVAQSTKRTLVLPPAQSMYLLDFGVGDVFHARSPEDVQKGGTTTKVEDLINLQQLKANLPTLTAVEFQKYTGLTWQDAVDQAGKVEKAMCNMTKYREVQDKFLYLSGGDREAFSCGQWWLRGGPTKEMKEDIEDTKPAFALLTHGFVWHDDVFSIASKVVNYLEIFKYMALHARYNDFQFQNKKVSPESLVESWAQLLKPGSVLWLATDQPKKFRNMLNANPSLLQGAELQGTSGGLAVLPIPSGARLLMWDDLFTAATGNLLTDVKAQYSPERWFKLTGPVEELICTYAQIFVGSTKSSFTGHIQRMRIHAKAPVTSIHYQTDKPEMTKITKELQEWEQADKLNNFDRLPATDGDLFLEQSSDLDGDH